MKYEQYSNDDSLCQKQRVQTYLREKKIKNKQEMESPVNQSSLENTISRSKIQFSFNNLVTTFNNQTLQLGDKYKDLESDLKKISQNDLIELLLEEIEENQKNKLDLHTFENKIHVLEEEKKEFDVVLRKKRQAIQLLCQTQTRNLNIIEKLEGQLTFRSEYQRETIYEKKYEKLVMYLDEYISNINQAQEQFTKTYYLLKSQNSKLYSQLQHFNKQILELKKKNNVLIQKWKKTEKDLNEKQQHLIDLGNQNKIAQEENQILRKEIEVFQENIRITDRLQAQFSKEAYQLSSELDFIHEKINQNHHISKDIIEKLDESSVNIEKVNKIKEELSEILAKQVQKNKEFQNQNVLLRRKNCKYEKQIQELKEELKRIQEEKQQVQYAYEEEKANKESVKRQLLSLAQKVRYIEDTYKKELEQTQKIKGQLNKYWESKQKRESQNKTLSEVKGIANFQHSQSQSTLSNSKTDYKGIKRKFQHHIPANKQNSSFYDEN